MKVSKTERKLMKKALKGTKYNPKKHARIVKAKFILQQQEKHDMQQNQIQKQESSEEDAKAS
jgi:hypothetical protein